MHNHLEFNEAPAIARPNDGLVQAASVMADPASQLMFREAKLSFGNTAMGILPDCTIDDDSLTNKIIQNLANWDFSANKNLPK